MRISPDLEQLVLSALSVSDQDEQTALQQLTTGRRVNQASDDPAAAAAEVNIAYQIDSCDQYQRSISSIGSELETADSSLNSAVTAIQSAISLGVEGANSTLSQSNRNTIAQEISGISQQVLSVANLSYNGHYVFAGTADAQPPYVTNSSSPGGVEYQGNDDVNSVEIEPGQSIAVNQPGSQLFSAAGANVFEALSDLVNALEDPNSTSDQIGSATNEVRNAYDQLTSARTFYGNTVDQITSTQNFLGNESIQLSQQQNNTVGVDMNVAATDLTNAEEARSATVQAAATVNDLSLMDYLSTINAS